MKRSSLLRAALVPVLLAAVVARVDAAPGDTDLAADAAAWKASGTDQVQVATRPAEGGAGVCLDFDFGKVSGAAALRRTLDLDLPPDYEFDLHLHGSVPANELHFKIADASGDNVWWRRDPDFSLAAARDLRIRQRDIGFAWGPSSDHNLRHGASLEITIARGREGGRGSLCVDSLALRTLPHLGDPPAPVISKVKVPARGGTRVLPALDAAGTVLPAWSLPAARGEDAFLVLDLGRQREIGGLVLRWRDGEPANRYEIELAGQGATPNAPQWKRARSVRGALGAHHFLQLPGAEARWVRILVPAGRQPHDATLEKIEVRGPGFAEDDVALFREIAQDAPRGRYPRGMRGEQPYWTIVGIPDPADGAVPALLSEDGAVEVGRGGFTVEPLLQIDGAWNTWADVQTTPLLPEGYLPQPRVHWQAPAGVSLEVQTFADGAGRSARLNLRYALRNTGDAPRRLRLALAVRPLQVNPPTQFLNVPGGVHPIHDLDWDGRMVRVDGAPALMAVQVPAGFWTSDYDAGSIVDRLYGGISDGPARSRLHDPLGYASGALVYEVLLAPGEQRSIDLAAPLAAVLPVVPADVTPPWVPDPEALAAVDARQEASAAAWRESLGRVGLRLPVAGQRIADTLRTALAHILMSRDGAALQPGTRSYSRTWIRDGAMMNEALLRLGHADEARAFLDWFTPFQYDNGKVPCCADRRGSDPVPENDSHGEFLFATAQYERYTRDPGFAARIWPNVVAAQGYLESLRQQERTPAQAAAHPELYGLLPASISHEGYMSKPMHSYWDDFWGLRGYDDAIYWARLTGHPAQASAWFTQRDEFRGDIRATIDAVRKQHGIDYIPGAAELGDFDATSTTVALAPLDERQATPAGSLEQTFERYWRNCERRRTDPSSWNDYTPYELRSVGSLVRLGWRDRAQSLLDYFFHDQRPQGWNQWAEVVGREARVPRFIGDMPHAWVASDYIRSALDLFAYEQGDDPAVVLAAGVPASWLEGEGIALERLRSSVGSISYRLRTDAQGVHLDMAEPPAGVALYLSWPLAKAAPLIINGRSQRQEAAAQGDLVRLSF